MASSDVGIDHAVLSWQAPADAEQDQIFIDNFTYQVVPVPGAALLGLLGLSVAGAKLRKMKA